LGPVDLLVNNAGVGGSPGALAAGDPDQWWQTIQVNLGGGLTTAPGRCCQPCWGAATAA
jgi:NADP-dependent 3-hydroxy acid dehydrogenase YdfG